MGSVVACDSSKCWERAKLVASDLLVLFDSEVEDVGRTSCHFASGVRQINFARSQISAEWSLRSPVGGRRVLRHNRCYSSLPSVSSHHSNGGSSPHAGRPFTLCSLHIFALHHSITPSLSCSFADRCVGAVGGIGHRRILRRLREFQRQLHRKSTRLENRRKDCRNLSVCVLYHCKLSSTISNTPNIASLERLYDHQC